ncbi:MAG: glycosyltransferase WbuB, partial [Bacteroidetes bacterium]
MHIALFYQYYHSYDCAATARHYTFIREWSKRHTISVLTSDVWQERRLTDRYPWTPEGVRLYRIRAPYDNRMGVGQRTLAFARYAAGALRAGLRLPHPDIIIGSSTPLTAAWAAARVARWRGIPWVFEVRDLWPDFPVQMGAVRHAWLRRRLYAMERALYASATHLVALSPDMAEHLRLSGVSADRITLLEQGTDFPLLDAWTD